ncbi:hypothetical protein M407DRAFT_5378 [Tulasnella calospora MUT 4182]|uniref:Uncharacterized protein n=1 Tax=Tulasnella calospora MUT 4182 TaxID=1051891 RepID=A0A0C3QGX3_9AGAM|nr:hypothetical protein M407DRAFT_5378 [Tulasnella calospora MUT 4182]
MCQIERWGAPCRLSVAAAQGQVPVTHVVLKSRRGPPPTAPAKPPPAEPSLGVNPSSRMIFKGPEECSNLAFGAQPVFRPARPSALVAETAPNPDTPLLPSVHLAPKF